MASHGIKDQVAIVSMGCTPFGEHWHMGADDLMIESTKEAFTNIGITKDDVDAYWLGTAMSGMSGRWRRREQELLCSSRSAVMSAPVSSSRRSVRSTFESTAIANGRQP